MKLKGIYQMAVEKGMANDPRGMREEDMELKRRKKE